MRSSGRKCGARAFAMLLVVALLIAPKVLPQTLSSTEPATAASTAPSTIPSTSPSTAPSTAPATEPAPSIPLAELASNLESTSAALRDVQGRLTSEQSTAAIPDDLASLVREIDARADENARLLDSNPSLDNLRNLEAGWARLYQTLYGWKVDLNTLAKSLDADVNRLQQLNKDWQHTVEAAADAGVPAAVMQRVEEVARSAKATNAETQKRRSDVLSLQSRVGEQFGRVNDALAAVKEARAAAVDRLLVKDSPPIWSARARSRSGQDLMREGQDSFSLQCAALRAYFQRQPERFLAHGFAFLGTLLAIFWVRRRTASWSTQPGLEHTAKVFQVPVATALVVTLLVSQLVYPQAPRLLMAIIGAAALVPAVLLLRRLIDRHLFPVLYALVAFYFVDQLRTVTASLPLVERFAFLFELLFACLFLGWFLGRWHMRDNPITAEDRLRHRVQLAARCVLVVFIVALAINVLGYVGLSTLIGNGALGSAYAAIILYAALRIGDGFLAAALLGWPLNLLSLVRRHGALLRRRLGRALEAATWVFWAYLTLDMLAIREPVTEWAVSIFTTALTVGSLNLSLGNVLAFVLAIWGSVLLSRFLRFALEEDVYPRLALPRGMPYAISTMLHYAVLLIGFFIAMAASGFDMTKFTILAGAFGVGLGFGLQNIVNNFVSGLILLVERPIKVGDVVQIGDTSGVVNRIGIRASVVRTPNGPDIIIPNGKLIADNVTNWTFSSRRRGIEIPVSVGQGVEPNRVMSILRDACAAHPLVAKEPAPQVLLVKFGADLLSFELRAWTNQFEDWTQIRSDLSVAINTMLTEQNIPIR